MHPLSSEFILIILVHERLFSMLYVGWMDGIDGMVVIGYSSSESPLVPITGQLKQRLTPEDQGSTPLVD